MVMVFFLHGDGIFFENDFVIGELLLIYTSIFYNKRFGYPSWMHFLIVQWLMRQGA